MKKPTYKVSTGKTGHAETVKVVYDPSIVSFSEVVDYFFLFMIQPPKISKAPMLELNIDLLPFIQLKRKI